MAALIIRTKNDGTGLDVIPGGPQAYLRQELGILLEQQKNDSIAKAITSPDKFIKKRTQMQDRAAHKAGEEFQGYMQELLNAGIPTETAKQTALLYAKTIYDAEMNIYELTNPGYATAVGAKEVVRDVQDKARDLYLQESDRKAYKKKVLDKYKAKKRAKNAAIMAAHGPR